MLKKRELLITELVKQLGGSIVENKSAKQKKFKLKKEVKQTDKKLNDDKAGKKKAKKIDHTYLFGKWKDFDIDARKLREESW